MKRKLGGEAATPVQGVLQRLEGVLALLPEAVLVSDAAGLILWANDAAARLFGTSAGQLRGPLAELPERFGLRPLQGQARPASFAARVLAGESAVGAERFSIPAAGGAGTARREVRASTVPLRGERGELEGALLLLQPAAGEEGEAERELAAASEHFLAEASVALAQSLDEAQTLSACAQVAVPFLADWCVVDLAERPEAPAQRAVAHADPALASLAAAVRATPLRPEPGSARAQVLERGEPLLLEPLHPVPGRAGPLGLVGVLDVGCCTVVPLLARGRTLGTLTLLSSPGGRRLPGAQTLALAADLGRRAALAVDNARLYAQAHAATERTQRLQRVIAALGTALTRVEVVEVVMGQAREALGAQTGAVALLDLHGEALELLSSQDIPAAVRERFQRIPLSTRTPLTQVVRTGEPQWLGTPEAYAQEYPAFSALTLPHTGSRALAAIPLTGAGGRTVGALSLGFPTAQYFGPEDRAFLLALAQHLSQALERARLYEAEHRARAEAEATSARAAFLAEASKLLASAPEPEETLDAVVRLAVPELVDGVVVDLLVEVGEAEAADPAWRAAAHVDPGCEAALHALARRSPHRRAAPSPLLRLLGPERTPRLAPVTDAQLQAAAEDEQQLQLLRAAGLEGVVGVGVPIASRGLQLGAVFLLVQSERPGRPGHSDIAMLALAEELARRIGQAADNARLAREAEGALRRKEESLALLDTLLHTAPFGHALFDLELRCVRINDALARMNGRSVAAHLGRAARDFLPTALPPAMHAALEARLRQVRDSGEPLFDQELELPAPAAPLDLREGPGGGGHGREPREGRLHGLASYYPVRTPGGWLMGIGMTVLDISARKVAEQARAHLLSQLRTERFLLEAVLQQMPAGVVIAEAPSGKSMLVNRRVEEIVRTPNSPVDSVDGYGRVQGFRADGSPLPAEEWPLARAVRRGETVLGEETEFLRGDGTRGVMRQSAGPVRDASGRVVAAVTAFFDVTEQRRAAAGQRLLSEASRVLASSLDYEQTLQRAMLLAVPELADWCAVTLVRREPPFGEEVLVAHADPTKAQLLERVRHRVHPDTDWAVTRVLRTGQGQLVAQLDPSAIERSQQDPELVAALREVGMHSLISAPLRTPGGTFGALTFVSARPERRYDEKDLALAEELARRAALAIENARLYRKTQGALQAREDMMAFVSHDLATPLLAITTTAQVLQQELPAGEAGAAARERVRWIQQSVAGMRRLVGDLLDLGRLEAGRLPLRPQRHPARSLVEGTFEAHSPLAAERGVRLVSALPVPEAPVFCDRERVLQVFNNLVGNALRFSPRGGAVTIRGEAREGEFLFCVADEGPGLSAEELPQVFGRFWRGKDRGHPGAGLGLYIARAVVEAHGGAIWVASEAGQGTSFFFTLPEG
ncbi:GAF domain-containing protein [Aggregicoccus sp. 17bor-14]|uniref:GAF domain-containing protein n=1 Tax=Myxococcaceae TaxID=31 RepID=UPI00129C980C|nr:MULTISPECIES: GAF domain-containing protein [Myxococcaceae]MBF5043546.1 GAF domain-containing protein [Simulacricoccus sp. 17bor-14]MRI89305.1 GAF domain-containing protein [Aggregicoccus sp. 17bor-14]